MAETLRPAFHRSDKLLLSPDLGDDTGGVEILHPGEHSSFKTVIPFGLLPKEDAARFPASLPLVEDEPALSLVRRSLGISLKSRVERAGCNLTRTRARITRDGLEIVGSVMHNGTAPIRYDKGDMFRIYGFFDSPFAAFGRVAAVAFDPARSIPRFAEEFTEANKGLLADLKGYGKQTERMPLLWQIQTAKFGALAFILPLQRHYVMRPNVLVDLTTGTSGPRQAIAPYEQPIQSQHDLGEIVDRNDRLVQIISDTPPMFFPQGWCGLVTAATRMTDPYRDGIHVGGWTVPYDLATSIYIGERPVHGGSNFVDPGFSDAIATEVLTTAQRPLPEYAAVLVTKI